MSKQIKQQELSEFFYNIPSTDGKKKKVVEKEEKEEIVNLPRGFGQQSVDPNQK